MAILESLSLTAGGGVVSAASQCNQKQGVVSLFIGLGGTGKDAIRAIKTQVNERLIPDNAAEYDDPNNNVSIREYKHIKFLSIDTDPRVAGQSGFDVLTRNEKKDITIEGFFGGPINTAHRPDLKWLTENGDLARIIAEGHGAGGLRQAGRYILFDSIREIKTEILNLINEASVGIADGAHIVVHIFSGVSGGTGSGTFLDICYAVREALNGIPNKRIIGYFFMPDINLSKRDLDEATRTFIPKNGYAALQELNYCMSLPENGGSFKQIINDATYIHWDCPPVEMCHIIGAETEKLANISANAYDYAMRTVTEYVMDFLSENPNQQFDAYQLASNQSVRIAQASAARTGGYKPCMVSIGAACASIPYKEINTYLVSSVFEEYRRIHKETVTQAEADTVIEKAWNVTSNPSHVTMVQKIYASLLQKLTGNDTDGVQGYNYFQDPDGSKKPWKYILETCNSNGENELEAFYQDALNSHIGFIANNADRLIGQIIDGRVNKDSLIYKLEQELDLIVKDITRGPKFAENILCFVEGSNVLNLIKGLKAMNNANNQAAIKDREFKYNDYTVSKSIFLNREKQGFGDSDAKRYADFEDCVLAYVQWIERVGGTYSNSPNATPMKGVYGHISDILDTLERQINDRIAQYYTPLSNALLDLTQTFEANFIKLSDVSQTNQNPGFDKPLISIKDIKGLLDSEIKKIPMSQKFSDFMSSLIEAGHDVWEHKEERLPKVVQSFFVGKAGIFRAFAGMSVDKLLGERYGLDGQDLEQIVYDEFVAYLVASSTPLLPVDSSKMNDQKQYLKKVTFPSTSNVLKNTLSNPAAGLGVHQWALIQSSISDRLLFVQIRDGFPLQAYSKIATYEQNYYTSTAQPGSHIYEKNGVLDDISYSDWRALPSITVPSMMGDNIPETLRIKRDSVKELFDKAVNLGVIKINEDNNSNLENAYSKIYDISKALQKEIDGMADELNSIFTGPGSASEKSSRFNALRRRVNELTAGGYKELTSAVCILKQSPCRTDKEEYDRMIKMDFLYMFPVYQDKVSEIIKKMDENLKTLNQISELINQREGELARLDANIRNNFYLAFCSGVIQLKEDGSIVYEYDDDGMLRPYVLSAYGNNMEYEEIPYYQAFISYLNLDAAIQDSIYRLASRTRATDGAQQYAQTLKAGRLANEAISRLRKKACDLFDADTAERIERFLIDLMRFEF